MIPRILLLVTITACISGCGKKNNGLPNALATNPESFNGIFLTEKDATNYNYLTITTAIMLYRQTVTKDYPLSDLKNEKDCYFFADWRGTGINAWFVSSVKDKNTFWRVYKSAADNKWAVGLQDVPGASPVPDLYDLSYQFIFHKLGKENGMDVVAIESKFAPGHFLSNTGLPVNAVNAASFTQHDTPQQATKFYIGKP
ncbi:MAG TPA: hypothetical protein PKC39_08115 [Ferruginibacter sp.]|nr:hypothetical protein [Ferruginibacter sp.]HMP20909.1 hypothetical protein [Ferruginibacter sp.]